MSEAIQITQQKLNEMQNQFVLGEVPEGGDENGMITAIDVYYGNKLTADVARANGTIITYEIVNNADVDIALLAILKEVYQQGYICGINDDELYQEYIDKIKTVVAS